MLNGWGFGNITYAEGFSGPGVYKDGSPGSPVIAVQSLIGDPALRTKVRDMRFLFVDREPRCTDMLQHHLRVACEPVPLEELSTRGIDLDVAVGPCEPTLDEVLTRHSAWGRPMLVVLDTWGGAVSFEVLHKIAQNVSSEVIITIKPQYFSRFAGVGEVAHGDRVFGSQLWRQVVNRRPADKARWLLQHYRETVTAAGFTHILDFELIDRKGQSLYLVFGTTHDLGLKKMKEAMWEVDEVHGVGYRDPRDPHQQTLDIEDEPQTSPLKRLILDHLSTTPNRQAAVYELRSFALYSTVYKESQVLPVVRELVDTRRLLCGATRVAFSDVVRLPS